MQRAPENAVIIYMDAGFSICGSLEPILDKLNHTDIILVQHDPNNSVFIFECTITNILKNEHVNFEWAKVNLPTMGGFIVTRNTPLARKFIEEWLNLCQKPNYLSGHGYKGPGHHYDQSLLSINYFKNQSKVNILTEEEMGQIVTWHHRHPSRNALTLLPYLRKHQTFFERRILNLPVLKDLRLWIRRHTTTILESSPQAIKGL